MEIDEAEAGVAEVILTATPSEPAPKAKLNQKIKKIGKLDIAFSMNRKKQARAVKTAKKMDNVHAMLAGCTVQRFADYTASSQFKWLAPELQYGMSFLNACIASVSPIFH